MAKGTFFILISLLALNAQGEFRPILPPPPVEWTVSLKNAGITLDSTQDFVLHQFEKQGISERQIIAVNLVRLAKDYPEKARQWINGATPILQSTFAVSEKHTTFKRTRASFLQSFMAAMWAEGNLRPNTQIFNDQSMVAAFKKFHHSPKSFYDVSAVFFAYSNLVSKGLMPPGSRTLKEAALQFKIANYKSQMDLPELSPAEENLFHKTTRQVASTHR